MVSVGGGAPVFHQADAVCLGVLERPVAAGPVRNREVYLETVYHRLLLAEGKPVDDGVALAGPVERGGTRED